MVEKTRIHFFGGLKPPYPGASSKGCSPTDPDVHSWMITVGGTHCHIKSAEDFARHVGDFLQYAYEAGIKDAKAELAERLGL